MQNLHTTPRPHGSGIATLGHCLSIPKTFSIGILVAPPCGVKLRDLIKELERDGWVQVRQESSHRHFRHPTKTGLVTVAGQPGVDVPIGTLKSILRRAGLYWKGKPS